MAAPCSEGKPCKGASAAAGKMSRAGLPSRALSWTEFQAHKRGANFELSLPESVWLCICVSRFWKTSQWKLQRGARERVSAHRGSRLRQGSKPLWPEPAAGGCELCPFEAVSLLAFLFMTCWTRVWQGWGTLKPSISVAFSVLLPTIAARRQTIFRVGKPLP